MREDPIEVKCYSGYTYGERPLSFSWQDVEYKIEEIEKAWLEPGERHFRIRTEDNRVFHLRYNERNKQWSLTEV